MRRLEIDTIISRKNLKSMDDMVLNFFYLLSKKDRFELNFVLHELLINILEAYEETDLLIEAYRLKFNIEIMEELVKIEVLDFAGGINILEKTTEIGLGKGLEIRGRGIMFVKHYMDYFNWRVHEEGGLIVTIEKVLQSTVLGGQYGSEL